MAKAFFNLLAQEQGLPLRSESVGTEPGGRVHPEVVEAMREVGVDLSRERPRLLTNDMAEQAGKVVTMGCQVDAGTCPAIFLRGVEDWGLPDPSGKSLEEVRAIRDMVRQRVAGLLDSLASRAPLLE